MKKIFNQVFCIPDFGSVTLRLSKTYLGRRSFQVFYTDILGSRQFGNIVFLSSLLVGGLGFLFVGLISYITDPTYTSEISFIPQGILLTFYGSLAITIGIFILFSWFWNVGSGYNELNKFDKLIRIQRRGYPGKNQTIFLTYQLSDVKSLEIKVIEGLNSTQTIYLCLKNERQIPLTFTDQLPVLTKVEQRATLLSNFLGVPLEIKTIKST